MADDRLDDAIDAVVRAVDQIERATRGSLAQQPPVAAQSPVPLNTPVVATRISPGKDAYSPLDSDAGLSKAERKARKRERARQAADAHSAAEGASGFDGPATGPGPGGNELQAASASLAQAIQEAAARTPSALAAPPAPSDDELNALVGQIVARTAELEEHLDAARTLRAEVTELVGRLAAVANKPR